MDTNQYTYKQEKLKLLYDIKDLVKAIESEVDWFIASRKEKSAKRQKIALVIYNRKKVETVNLAKRMVHQYGR